MKAILTLAENYVEGRGIKFPRALARVESNLYRINTRVIAQRNHKLGKM